MMLSDISIEQIDGFSCIDAVISGVSKWIDTDYLLMFGDSWGFQYSREFNNDGRLSGLSHNSYRKLELLRIYCGIDIIEKDISNIYKVIDIIKSELSNNRPVILMINTFWCPWDIINYQKNNINHWLLAVDFDSDTNKIKCIDSEKAKAGMWLDSSHFNKGIIKYYLIKHDLPVKKININDILKNAFLRLEDESIGINRFNEMIYFSEDIINIFDIVKETEKFTDRPDASPFFRELYEIASGRNKFAMLLESYDMDNIPEITLIIRKLKELNNMWMAVFGMLLKAYYIKEKGLMYKKISDKILFISEEEQKLAFFIKDYLDRGKSDRILKDLNEYINYNKVIKEHIIIDLYEHFDNKGLGLKEKIYDFAELSNPKRIMVIDEVKDVDVINISNMKFKFSYVHRKKDNIICKGQKIAIDNIKANYIMFLSCSEYGNYNEEIKVYFSNGKSEDIKFVVSSWGNKLSKYDEVKALDGKLGQQINGKWEILDNRTSLFAKCYKLKTNGNVCCIELPNCLNIHIFAITLAN
ncbi:hypothetical protein CIW83_05460 [Tissierella sp. P1]|uniref:hypothetical protein n=1 Tax=Tissierella sp. P1 TaxID=1280483 RepID=UPI000B9FD001|nr:hypothetical protein [Tissierella sp. P1]OZV12994.1 hypothetical protein CIW83_05460 [Tissierella sp. P1]